MSEHDHSQVLDALCQRADRYYAETGRPFVTVSYAQSLDGSIAGPGGAPLTISGRESLVYTHAVRGCHDAILVGIGTVLSDNPALTTRLVEGPNPCPVILDSRLRIPLDAQVLACNNDEQPLVVTTPMHDPERRIALEAQGVRVVPVVADARGWVGLDALLSRLGALGVKRLMVEGGARVITSFFRTRCVQHLIVTVSMKLVGGLPAMQVGENEKRLRARLAPSKKLWMGEDLILHGDPIWEQE